jgi:hypothetical protein
MNNSPTQENPMVITGEFQTPGTSERTYSKEEFERELNNNQKEAIAKYGNVPVIYGPTKRMIQPPAEPGLTQLIKNAMSENEVNNLLKTGENYKNVSVKTLKKWEKIAQQRISELINK